MRRVDIASCPTDRNRLYAVCGGGFNVKQNIDPKTSKPVLDDFGNAKWVDDDDFILAVLSSTGNGGSAWYPTGTTVTGQTLSLFPGSPSSKLAGHTQNGYVGCVGVSPFDPDHIAIGMTNVFISKDGGGNWVRHSVETNSHLHADTHAVVFDPTDAATLHVCSDGGLATTPDLGDGWRSASNRQLPNLEFYDFSPSIVDSGLIAGSVQDNGTLYAPLYITTEPWRMLRGGDGEITRFIPMSGLAWQDNEAIGALKVGVRADFWRASERLFYELPILLDVTSKRLVITDILGRIPPKQLIAAVNTPALLNPKGEEMVAVAAIGLTVYGMFLRSGFAPHWQVIGAIPSRAC